MNPQYLYFYIALIAISLLGSGCSNNNDVNLDQWRVSVPIDGQSVSVAYGTIVNHSNHSIELTAVHSDQARAIEIHQHQHHHGMMSMVKIDAITIEAKSELIFTSGDYHLMVFDLNPDIIDSDKLMTLTFEFSDYPMQSVNATFFKH